MKTALLSSALALLAACSSTSHARQDQATTIPAVAGSDNSTVYKVIPLRYASADQLASALRNALVTQPNSRSPQVVSDPRTNSVIVTCMPSELDSIERLIADLDVQVEKS